MDLIRLRFVLLTLMCVLVTPVLLLTMLLESVGGSTARAQGMANAFDQCGNALFGGSEKVTISERTGNGVIQKLRWAIKVAPIIDLFFGKGHCASKATVKE